MKREKDEEREIKKERENNLNMHIFGNVKTLDSHV